MKKPISSDPEQRRHDTRVSRFQSGLPPEDEFEEQETPPKQSSPERKSAGKSGSTEEKP